MTNRRKLRPLSAIGGKPDSVKKRKADERFKDKNLDLLKRCSNLWWNLASQRDMRQRCKQYTYGGQWDDLITYDGKTMTEKEYMLSRGQVPLTNNLVRRLVNNVVGTYAKNEVEPRCSARDRDEQQAGEMMSIALQANWQINKMQELLAVIFEDFLIGAVAISRETYEYREDIMDTWTDMCNPNYLFFDSLMKDPRHTDISLIGEIHDISFNELCSRFSKTPEEYHRLKDMYYNTALNTTTLGLDAYKKHEKDRINFYSPTDTNVCRVFEIWTKEIKPRYRCHDQLQGKMFKINEEDLQFIISENENRLVEGQQQGMPKEEIPLINYTYFFDNYWYYQFLSPHGDILMEGETPYEHKSHPYTIKVYPFIDGEAHSFVNDVIDQQRHINRMISLNDFILRTGAKGVTMMPTQAIPDNMSPEEFAKDWSTADGLLFYTPKPGIDNEPKQYFSNAKSLGLSEIIAMQMQMMEDIASVHGASQGKQAYAGTSAALYAQQSQNAFTSLVNILNRFTSFSQDLAKKKLKNIQQFYTDKRMINIGGKKFANIKEYDPTVTRDIEYDLSLHEGAATPNYRMFVNDMLMEFWKNGAISIEMLLENGDFPFADQLLQSIEVMKQQQQQQGQPQAFPPGMMQQVNPNGPPQMP